MIDRVESYLKVLEQSLQHRIPQDLRTQRIAELRSHLHLSIQDRISGGQTESEAISESIRNLGSPAVVAGDLVRQQRGYDRRSAWGLSLSILLLFVVLDAIAFLSAGIRPLQSTWPAVERFSWVPLLGLFGWRVWTTRRWLVAPILTFSLLVTILPGLVMSLTRANYAYNGSVHFLSRSQAANLRKQVPTEVLDMQQELAGGRQVYAEVLAGGHTSRKEDGYLVPCASEMKLTGWVPGAVVSASHSYPTGYFLERIRSIGQAEADLRWKNDGARALKEMQESLSIELDFLADKPIHNRGFDNIQVKGMMLSLLTIGMNAIFFFGANWLLLALSKARRLSQNAKNPLVA